MKNRNDEVFNALKEFITKNYWSTKPGLTRETRISQDLRIEGDDASELMQKFGRQFNVDLSAFEFEKYFMLEGFDPIGFSHVIRKLRGDKIPKRSSKSITLGDLEKAAKVGKWVDP